MNMRMTIKPRITGLLAKHTLTECSKQHLQALNSKYLFTIKTVAELMSKLSLGVHSYKECMTFLLGWKPNDKLTTHFNTGIEGKYFYYKRAKVLKEEYATASEGFKA